MRGQTFFSYALVAYAASVVAAPLDVIEERNPYQVPGLALAVKIGTVNSGKFFERRQPVHC